ECLERHRPFMSWVVVSFVIQAQSRLMSWEDTLMDRLRQLFRSRRIDIKQPDNATQRRRSNRMRYFLTVFGSQHWAERVEGRRT
ncbi:MAG: hypothetical protein M3O99_09670, partial [Chloroflexota bacterium]|nr:hypothetical protein [Chloroflexota bacterium]